MRTKAELWQWLQDTYHDGLKSNDIMLISGNRFLKFMHDFELVVMQGQDQDGVDLNTVVEEDVLPSDRRNYRVSIPASNYTQDYLSLSPQKSTSVVNSEASVNVSSNVAVESTSTTSALQTEDVNNSDVNFADASRADDKVAESSSDIAPGFRLDENSSNIDDSGNVESDQASSTSSDNNYTNSDVDTDSLGYASNFQSEFDGQDEDDSGVSHGSTYSDLDNEDADNDDTSMSPEKIGSSVTSGMHSEVSSVMSSTIADSISESVIPSQISTSVDPATTSQVQSTNKLSSEDQDHSEYSDNNSLSDLSSDDVADSETSVEPQTGLENLMNATSQSDSKFGIKSESYSNGDMPF